MNPYKKTRTVLNGLMATAALLTAAFAPPASAQTWSSNIQGQAPPANVAYGTSGAWESDTSILGFFEGGCTQLEDDLVVNIDSPGTYFGGGNTLLPVRTIAEGTWVRSHFLHADLDQEEEVDWDGWVQVDEDILGVIIEDETLDLSTAMEALGTSYPLNTPNRGMEANDSITLVAGMRRLEIDRWHMTRPGDQLRFLTACACPPPEPEHVDGALNGHPWQSPAPPSVLLTNNSQVPGGWESDSEIQAFYESCVELSTDLDVDGSTIPAGTNVRCRMLHLDSTNGGYVELDGTVFLSEPLLGTITSDTGLDASDDVCGLAGTIYPTGLEHRGLEGSDSVQVNAAGDEVYVDLRVTSPGDQVRIVTECCPIGSDPVFAGEGASEGEGDREGEQESETDCGDEDEGEGEIDGEDFVDSRPEGCSCNPEETAMSALTMSMLGLFPMGLARRGRRRESL